MSIEAELLFWGHWALGWISGVLRQISGAVRERKKKYVGGQSWCSVESDPRFCARRAFVLGYAMPVWKDTGVVGR